MLELIKAAIIGIVEGLTEFLPVSSTGHIIIAEQFVHMRESKQFMDMFNYVIQFGAILAVIVLYFNKLNPFSGKKDAEEKKQTWILWFKVVVAILPSVVVGLALNDWMDAHLMTWQVVSAFFIIYGVIFIFVEKHNEKQTPRHANLYTLPWKTALFIGLFQVLSIVPGTSRSGATILGGILVGASRFVASEFSFFLAIPTMIGVTILKVGKFLLEGNTFNGPQTMVLFMGTLVSFIVAIIAIKTFLGFIKTHDFKAFGYYRIVAGIVFIILGLMGVLQGNLS
ncbi:undecaprenyl-diphosphate phosphatase [Periweissella fabaria]|uniref:Undecaprenyl-diphosphatase n=1 Tax=Periweissella fabaria TaxID=546157 RepID=A0ABN8BKT6_9LACO|nr:undecaprenyl-diphosphate phosphatase [Periweissella fabaria]MCM0597569.1 undecaprenyl-diphosphate phosphatase [Periweissella fabaria]CAH0416754.1 Undecaprenyl-diphosphatase [Periweissella fabaria]